MSDTDRLARLEAVQPAPNRPEPAPHRSDAIRAEAPQGGQAGLSKPSRWRRVMLGAGVLFGLYLLGVALGLVPCSYSSFTVSGRSVVVVSYSPSVALFSTPSMTQIDTRGQRIIIRGNVVDLGSGRTMPIPPWCQEVRVTVQHGRVFITFTAP